MCRCWPWRTGGAGLEWGAGGGGGGEERDRDVGPKIVGDTDMLGIIIITVIIIGTFLTSWGRRRHGCINLSVFPTSSAEAHSKLT